MKYISILQIYANDLNIVSTLMKWIIHSCGFASITHIFSTEYVQLLTHTQRSYKNAPISFGISLSTFCISITVKRIYMEVDNNRLYWNLSVHFNCNRNRIKTTQALFEDQQAFPPESRAQNCLYVLNGKNFKGKLYTDVKQSARAMNGLLPYCLRGNYTDAAERIRLFLYVCVSPLIIVL